jgi:hypothetical protein
MRDVQVVQHVNGEAFLVNGRLHRPLRRIVIARLSARRLSRDEVYSARLGNFSTGRHSIHTRGSAPIRVRLPVIIRNVGKIALLISENISGQQHAIAHERPDATAAVGSEDQRAIPDGHEHRMSKIRVA